MIKLISIQGKDNVSPIPFVRLQLELSRENISDIPSKMIEENGTEDQEEECQRTY